MCRERALATWTLISSVWVVFFLALGRGATIKINPVPCSNALGNTGTCMFVWQCIKQGGDQLGTCVDGFLVGSCCRVPTEEDNLVPGASSGTHTLKPIRPPPPPATTSTTTTTTLVHQTPSAATMTSPPLTVVTFRPTVIEATLGPTVRPIVSQLVGQSAVGQAVVDHSPSTEAPPSEEDYSECGISRPKPKPKVVGGTHSAFGDWPWQASVRKSSFFGFASTHRCGGAILNANWIATAGHCVDDLQRAQLRVRVGEYDFSTVLEPRPHQERGVERKVVHPRYNFYTYEHDLALLRLDSPLQLRPHVRPICLPPDSATEEALVGVNATVTGWGRLSEGGTLPTKLQQVQVPILSNSKCKQMFLAAGRQESIPDIFLCAGYETGGRDSCQGDSGGPLQAKGEDGRWFLAGIISWGIGCAEANMPGVCTRITKFKDWILETIS